MTDEKILSEDTEILQELFAEDADEQSEAAPEEDPSAGYERRISELEERLRAAEAENSARERKLSCMALLGSAGLPAELAPAVMGTADMAQTVEMIVGAVNSAVEAEILRRCRSDAPATGTKAPLTKEDLMRLPVAELQRIHDMGR